MNSASYIYKNRYRYVFALLLLMFAAALGSCIHSDMETFPGGNATEETVTVRLNLPGMKSPATRAMSQEQENTLDPDMLNVFVVKGNTYFKVELLGSIIYDPGDHSKATITVRLPKSADENDKIRLCVSANHTIQNTPPLWFAFRLIQQMEVPGKWPTNQLIPMWGESAAEFVVDETMGVQTVDMYRSLARIDVGLDFTEENGKLTETALGLSDFKINSVYLPCTTDYMFVPTSLTPDQPNVPADHIRDPDNPLAYVGLGSVDSYVREIYVPEAAVQADRNKMYCLIVGGFFDGSTTETYYRLDFVKDNGDQTTTTLPILRNHRYVFNIKDIKLKGYSSVSEAFDRQGAIAGLQIEYEVEVMDDYIHYVERRDGYYFGLDNRDVVFGSQAALTHVVGYQTDVTDPVSFEWADPVTGDQHYTVTVGAGGELTLTTKTENISGHTWLNTLYVKAGPFSIPVRVEQRSVNFRYAIDPQSVRINGAYIVGQALDATHYIDLTILAENNTLQGKTYIIETEAPGGDHGISFRAEGVFNLTPTAPYSMNIRLQGTGTIPVSARSTPFELCIMTNSYTGDCSEITILPLGETMTVVVMDYKPDTYGFAIDRLTGGSGKVINHTNNFGPYNNSIVKMAGFNYINTYEEISGYSFVNHPASESYKWITGYEGSQKTHKLADIVYVGYFANFDAATATALATYLDDGGVVVAFNENATYAPLLIERLYKSLTETLNGSQGAAGGPIYPMPANPALFTGDDAEENRQAALMKFEGDPILTGPFGDIRDKQIGDDRGFGYSFTNLPTTGDYEDIVTVYSYFNDINASTPIINSTRVFGFRYEDKSTTGRNFFFWGDGGPMTSNNGTPDSTLSTYFPFNWDATSLFPVPRNDYGYNVSRQMPVYNSAMFCNVMAWAVNKSQELKQRRINAVQ